MTEFTQFIKFLDALHSLAYRYGKFGKIKALYNSLENCHCFVRKLSLLLRSSFEDRSAQQPSSAAADVVYSPTHSQTSPSSSSSAATSPKSSPGGNDEPSTRLPTKRRRKNAAQPDRRIAIPLPSTLSLPHPQHNRSDQVNMIGANHSVAHILPLSVDQCVLGEFLNCMRPLGMKHSQTQPLIWPSTIDLVNACNDLGTLNNRWMHTLWRPF
ncbi:unnamed protein product [Toxocara canis]|uniref:Uncharacterized protein n=1 Tax=Toxocara canis TaxID=6265 RepID=A0A183V042_TOXCA|nr:unnamed protein product [Toxocara canis]